MTAPKRRSRPAREWWAHVGAVWPKRLYACPTEGKLESIGCGNYTLRRIRVREVLPRPGKKKGAKP